MCDMSCKNFVNLITVSVDERSCRSRTWWCDMSGRKFINVITLGENFKDGTSF